MIQHSNSLVMSTMERNRHRQWSEIEGFVHSLVVVLAVPSVGTGRSTMASASASSPQLFPTASVAEMHCRSPSRRSILVVWRTDHLVRPDKTAKRI